MPENGNGTFEIWNFGETFNRQKAAYVKILQMQDEVHEMHRKTAGTLFRAKEQVAEFSARTDVTPEQKAQVEALLLQADALFQKSAAFVVKVDTMRLTMLRDVVDEIGDTLQRLKATRSLVQLGETGLETSFDPLLAGVVARYKAVYRPMFRLHLSPKDVLDPYNPLASPLVYGEVPDPTGWTEQDWERIALRLDGPLFFWSPGECEKNWPRVDPNVPDCDGPDYFTTLTMINMVHVAMRNQLDIWREFPIIASFDMIVMGGSLEEYEEIIGKAQKALDAALESGEDILKLIAALLKALRKGAEALAGAPGILIAAGVVAYLVLRRKK